MLTSIFLIKSDTSIMNRMLEEYQISSVTRILKNNNPHETISYREVYLIQYKDRCLISSINLADLLNE
jgi:hypothetical protein